MVDSSPKYVAMPQEDKEAATPLADKCFVAVRSSIDAPEVRTYGADSPGEENQSVHAQVIEPEAMESEKFKPRKNRRKLYMIIGVIAGVMVILAAVLGGVLGSRNASKRSSPSSSSSPTSSSNSTTNSTSDSSLPHPANRTSLATGATSDNLYLYYQSENGSIIEAVYNASAVNSVAGSSEEISTGWDVVTESADSQSPLAVTKWTDESSGLIRRIMVFSSDGYVAQTNFTEGSPWTEHTIISDVEFSPKSRALCICAEFEYMGGFRLYFGSAEGYIQEIGWWSGDDIWNAGSPAFTTSDPDADVACTIQYGDDESWINVYLRNADSSALQQVWWQYPDPTNATWTNNTSPYTLPTDTRIAAAYDGTGTDNVVALLPNGTVVREATAPHAEQWLKAQEVLETRLNSEAGDVAAWYMGGAGVIWVYQDSEGGIRAVDEDGSFNITLV